MAPVVWKSKTVIEQPPDHSVVASEDWLTYSRQFTCQNAYAELLNISHVGIILEIFRYIFTHTSIKTNNEPYKLQS